MKIAAHTQAPAIPSPATVWTNVDFLYVWSDVLVFDISVVISCCLDNSVTVAVAMLEIKFAVVVTMVVSIGSSDGSGMFSWPGSDMVLFFCLFLFVNNVSRHITIIITEFVRYVTVTMVLVDHVSKAMAFLKYK